jgi:prepilin-type processing-associated H-X9-DG protein
MRSPPYKDGIPMNGKRTTTSGGFTIRDLLSSLAVFSICATVAIPAIGNSRTTSDAAICLSNLRHLSVALELYSLENDDYYPNTLQGGDAALGAGANHPRLAPWACGWLSWTADLDNTNVNFIRNAKYARIAPYIATERNIHKCPSDIYLSSFQRQSGWKERVRTISISAAIAPAGLRGTTSFDSSYFGLARSSDIAGTGKSPAEVFTFLDENPDSMNDPAFLLPQRDRWVDFPGALHEGAGTFAFLDGHAEMHDWRAVGRLRIRFSNPLQNTNQMPDIAWIRAHSPLK